MNLPPANFSSVVMLALGLGLFLHSGCALHHYDAETGTEHLWGFGHFRMKAPPQTGARPVVVGTQLLGLNLQTGRDDYGVSVGWDSQARMTMPANGTLLMEWPTNVSPLPREMRDLFTVRIGTNLPPSWEYPVDDTSTPSKNKP